MFNKGKRYVFSGRKFIISQGKEEYKACETWIKCVRGVVFIPKKDTGDSQDVLGMGVTDTWATQLPDLKIITRKVPEAIEEDAIPTMEELAESQELCQHCNWTERGLRDTLSVYCTGGEPIMCEGSGCADAYEYYLEQREDN